MSHSATTTSIIRPAPVITARGSSPGLAPANRAHCRCYLVVAAVRGDHRPFRDGIDRAVGARLNAGVGEPPRAKVEPGPGGPPGLIDHAEPATLRRVRHSVNASPVAAGGSGATGATDAAMIRHLPAAPPPVPAG